MGGYNGDMESQVRNNSEQSRYELVIDGGVVGVADYTLDGDRVVIPHTEIDPRRRGQSLGAVLVRGVLDDVRASGRKVVPLCWYVAQFIERQEEYRDLVAG